MIAFFLSAFLSQRISFQSFRDGFRRMTLHKKRRHCSNRAQGHFRRFAKGRKFQKKGKGRVQGFSGKSRGAQTQYEISRRAFFDWRAESTFLFQRGSARGFSRTRKRFGERFQNANRIAANRRARRVAHNRWLGNLRQGMLLPRHQRQTAPCFYPNGERPKSFAELNENFRTMRTAFVLPFIRIWFLFWSAKKASPRRRADFLWRNEFQNHGNQSAFFNDKTLRWGRQDYRSKFKAFHKGKQSLANKLKKKSVASRKACVIFSTQNLNAPKFFLRRICVCDKMKLWLDERKKKTSLD